MSNEQVKYAGKPISAELLLRSVVEAIEKRDAINEQLTDAIKDIKILIDQVQGRFKSGYYVVGEYVVFVDNAFDASNPVRIDKINKTEFDDHGFF